jgi:hypothetical protein
MNLLSFWAPEILPLLHEAQLMSPLRDKTKSISRHDLQGNTLLDPIENHPRVVDMAWGVLRVRTGVLHPQVLPELVVTVTPPGARWVWTVKVGGEMGREDVTLQFLCAPTLLHALRANYRETIAGREETGLRKGLQNVCEILSRNP